MILGGKDNIVCNKTAKNFFDVVPIEDKAIVNYDDLDHMIIHDAEYLPMIVRDVSGFFDTHR